MQLGEAAAEAFDARAGWQEQFLKDGALAIPTFVGMTRYRDDEYRDDEVSG